MKKEEFVWVPCSDWGWDLKAERDAENVTYVAKAPNKSGRPKLTEEQRADSRKRRNARERERQHRSFVPVKPTTFCGKCGVGLSKQNRIGFCGTCATKAVRNEIKLGPRPRCHCGVMLNRHNKTGLCDKHSASMRTMAYQARKKAAA